ncbi:MAG: hypothetical protein VR69_05770 [Peptococcaceae bacterium BRH_c4b]|nr:MAG: hypothetical protein VR69_05770 [Peptococcaceae bacterium BRH_c4b]
MNCIHVKEKLAQYLAGDCPCYEEREIALHLSDCPDCSREMEELREVNLLLWQLPSRLAPPDFLDGVMAAIEGREHEKTGDPFFNKAWTNTLPSRIHKKSSFSRRGWGTLRDLALAAAVTLGVFWYGGSWFDNQHIISAGNKLDLAFRSYVHYSGDALNKACTNIENLNGTLLKERY